MGARLNGKRAKSGSTVGSSHEVRRFTSFQPGHDHSAAVHRSRTIHLVSDTWRDHCLAKSNFDPIGIVVD
jgi:hypothetical protein